MSAIVICILSNFRNMNIWLVQKPGLNVSPHLSLANHNTNEIPLGFYIHTAKYAFNYFPGIVKEEFS